MGKDVNIMQLCIVYSVVIFIKRGGLCIKETTKRISDKQFT